MPTQLHLPVQPAGAQEINAVVAMVRMHGQVAYFASGVPLFVHHDADRAGRRLAAVQLMELGLARQQEISRCLGVDRSTLYRQQRKLTAQGVLGVVDGKRGPHGPHRFTPDKRQRVQGGPGRGLPRPPAPRHAGPPGTWDLPYRPPAALLLGSTPRPGATSARAGACRA